MVEHAAVGAKFLFVERGEDKWKAEIQRLADAVGLTLGPFQPAKSTMDTDEEKTDLGQLFVDIGWHPRLGWNAFWVVGTKNN